MRLTILLAVFSLSACSSEVPSSRPPLTQRQRDSAIGASGLPGAQGVTGALKASDAAAARSAVADSIQQ